MICRGGNRKNSIPDESPIPSCSLAESNGVCSCRKDSRFSYNHRSVFSAAAQQSGQGCRHRQEPDGLDGSILSGSNDPGTAVDKAER